MDRRDKTNYYLDMAQVALERGTCLRRNLARSSSRTTSSYPPATTVRREVVPTASTSAPAFVRRWAFRAAKIRVLPLGACGDDAIIAAPRDQMIGATLYLVGRDMSTGKIMSDANSCTMCKRLIINAGIEKVVIRRDVDTYDTVNVHDWVENDDTLGSSMAY